MHNFAGIQDAIRIKGLLDSAKHIIEYRTEHFFLKRTADQAIAVLAGKGPAVLEHQVRNLLGDAVEVVDPGLGFHVHHRPDMQEPHRGVRIKPGFGLVRG